ncbi:MAG TPA: hypothetical protein VGI40_20395 [Pirellulaceae bacterium]|jgi:hypothetical protein
MFRYRVRTLLIVIAICGAVLGRVSYLERQMTIHGQAFSKILSLYSRPIIYMDEHHWYEARDH